MRFVLPIAAATLLLATSAVAQVTIPAGSAAPVIATGSTTPRTLASRFADAANAKDFGADPTGTNDSATAINAAAAVGAGSAQPRDVHLPAGTYLLNNPITIGPNQCLVGDGRAETIINVTTTFNASATGVVILSGRELTGSTRAPCVRDVQIAFNQINGTPATTTAVTAAGSNTITLASAAGLAVGDLITDTTNTAAIPTSTTVLTIAGTTVTLSANVASPGVSSGDALVAMAPRSAATTLAEGCSIAPGGAICAYPPAINATAANRFQIQNVTIVNAWDGVDAVGNTGGLWIDNLEVSAFDIGLHIDGAYDSVHVKGYHFWNFGSTTGRNLVFYDGGTYAGQFGQSDWAEFVDVISFVGRIAVLSDASSQWWSNVVLDTNATFEVAGGLVLASGLSTDGPLPGPLAGVCPVNVTGGSVYITNDYMGSAMTDACVSAGTLSINGGTVANLVQTEPAAKTTGGLLEVRNLHVAVNTGYTWSPAMFQATGTGTLVVTGNTFPTTSVAAGPAVSIATDNQQNYVANNLLNGWTVAATGPAGRYGPNSNEFANYPYNAVGIGAGAMLHTASGATQTTAVGTGALGNGNPIAANNTAVGYRALYQSTGTNNVAVGADAGANLVSGTNNTIVGYWAAPSYTGTDATVVGENALDGASASGNANTVFGYNAATDITTGANNIVVGPNVASTQLATGSSNILIGTSSSVDTPATTTSNYLNIGGLLIGDVSKGHTAFGGSTGALSSCGTSPSIATGSTDHVGTITAGATASTCTLTWANAWAAAPSCNVTSRSGLPLTYTPGTTTLVVSNASLASSTFDYRCDGLGTAAP